MRHRARPRARARETDVQAMIPVAGEQGSARRSVSAFTSRARARGLLVRTGYGHVCRCVSAGQPDEQARPNCSLHRCPARDYSNVVTWFVGLHASSNALLMWEAYRSNSLWISRLRAARR